MSQLRRSTIETLELRRLLAGLPEGQLFLYLLNEARHDPPAFQRAVGLTVDLSNVAKRPPLAWNANIQNAAQFKSNEMATYDYFGHQSKVTGQWPNANVRANGYNLPSWFPDDNNYLESIGAGTFRNVAIEGLKPLLVSESHRNHLLGIDSFNAGQKEAAVGYAINPNAFYTNYWTVHATRTDPSGSFLTGVVFDDLNDNGRYDLNEGQSGVVISVGASQVVTNAAGGWSIAAAENQRHVVSMHAASGMVSTLVDVGTENREVDFRVDSNTIRVDFGAWVGSTDVIAPSATLIANGLTMRQVSSHAISVTYQDNISLNPASLKTGNIVVDGPHGFQQTATLTSTEQIGGHWKANYQIVAPNQVWTNVQDGQYTVRMEANQVFDGSGNAVPAANLGGFRIAISTATYAEDVNDDSIVSPVDALIVINHINASKSYELLLDVNRDRQVSATDVLLVINCLNSSGAGEGERSSGEAALGLAARDTYFGDLGSSSIHRRQKLLPGLLESCSTSL